MDAAKQAYLRLDYEEAIPLLLNASKLGNGQADFLLGRIYGYGLFVTKNTSKEEEYYRNAIKKGCGWGYYGLATLAERQFNKTEALKLYGLAFEDAYQDANRSEPFACFMLGVMLSLGYGVKIEHHCSRKRPPNRSI